ncbi:MAG: ribosome maturation factor RimM [Woeseiaceae bacterium]
MSAEANDRVIVGEIRGIYGVKGWVRLFSWTSPRENLLRFSAFEDQNGKTWTLVRGRPQGKGLIGQLKGVDDRDAAAALNGTMLTVARDALPATEKDEYYWADLEGCSVSDMEGQLIGLVDYLIETGSNDVLVVRTSDGVETLIPFITESVVKTVDIDAKRIVVDWVGTEYQA